MRRAVRERVRPRATGVAVAALVTVAVAVLVGAPASGADGLTYLSGLAKPAAAARVRVLVVGDSVAEFAGDEGFPGLLTTPGLDVMNLGSVGCNMFAGLRAIKAPTGDILIRKLPYCADLWAPVVASFKPNVVVWLKAGPGATIFDFNGHWTTPCQALWDQTLESTMHSQIRLLSSQGARVIVATAAYERLPYEQIAWMQHDDCHNAIVRKVAAAEPSAALADVYAWLCPKVDQACMRYAGALIILRPDGLHFRGASARLLAAWLIKQGQRHGVLTNLRVQGPEAIEVNMPLRP